MEILLYTHTHIASMKCEVKVLEMAENRHLGTSNIASNVGMR